MIETRGIASIVTVLPFYLNYHCILVSVYDSANQVQEADNLGFESCAGHHHKHGQVDDHPVHPPLNQRRYHQKRPGIHPDHQQPSSNLSNIHGHEASERELVEEVPDTKTDNCCHCHGCKRTEGIYCEEIECHRAEERYPHKDKMAGMKTPLSVCKVSARIASSLGFRLSFGVQLPNNVSCLSQELDLLVMIYFRVRPDSRSFYGFPGSVTKVL